MSIQTLEPCVAIALNALAVPILRAFCDALLVNKAIVDAEILKQQEQILKHDFLAAQAALAVEPVNAALDLAEEGLNFFPNIEDFGNLISECLQLGIVLTSPQDTLQGIREVANALLRRAQELASFSEELGEAVQALQNLSQLLTDFCDCIAIIIVQKEAPPAAV